MCNLKPVCKSFAYFTWCTMLCVCSYSFLFIYWLIFKWPPTSPSSKPLTNSSSQTTDSPASSAKDSSRCLPTTTPTKTACSSRTKSRTLLPRSSMKNPRSCTTWSKTCSGTTKTATIASPTLSLYKCIDLGQFHSLVAFRVAGHTTTA